MASDDGRILRQLPAASVRRLAARFKASDSMGLLCTTFAPTSGTGDKLVGSPHRNGWRRFEDTVVSNAVGALASPAFPSLALPSAEAFADELSTNRYLAAVLALAHAHRAEDYGAVDCHNRLVAGNHLDADRDLDEFESQFCTELERMSQNQKRAITPFLQRAGFHVLLFEEDNDCPMSICWVDSLLRSPTHLEVTEAIEQAKRGFGEFVQHYPPRTFKVVCQRAVIKCMPKLLAWLRQARIRLAAPENVDPAAEAAAMNDEMAVNAPLIDRDARQQEALKQRMRDSIHATVDENGWADRWAAVTGPPVHNPLGSTLVFVEAARNGHMALRPYEGQPTDPSDEVVLVADRDIRIEWVGGGFINGEFWTSAALAQSFPLVCTGM